jgi:four helix bundle suffix protein
MSERPIVKPYGQYEKLRCFELATAVYDGTVHFCARYIDRRSRTTDQMVQAARSGKQNIAEGSMGSAVSKKSELKLIGVARASLAELLEDYKDYLRQNDLELWAKDHPKAVFIRNLYKKNQSDPTAKNPYSLYKPYIEEKSAETAANTLVCLIHQACYLLDRLLIRLEKDFVEQGGIHEAMYRARMKHRTGQTNLSDANDLTDRSDPTDPTAQTNPSNRSNPTDPSD